MVEVVSYGLWCVVQPTPAPPPSFGVCNFPNHILLSIIYETEHSPQNVENSSPSPKPQAVLPPPTSARSNK